MSACSHTSYQIGLLWNHQLHMSGVSSTVLGSSGMSHARMCVPYLKTCVKQSHICHPVNAVKLSSDIIVDEALCPQLDKWVCVCGFSSATACYWPEVKLNDAFVYVWLEQRVWGGMGARCLSKLQLLGLASVWPQWINTVTITLRAAEAVLNISSCLPKWPIILKYWRTKSESPIRANLWG